MIRSLQRFKSKDLCKELDKRLNLRTVVEDAKVGDHGSNAAVEKAIDRIRNQASVFLHALTMNIVISGFCHNILCLLGRLHMLDRR